MRRAVLGMVSLAVLVACESDMQVSPAFVEWMEWPADVAPATSYPVRLRGGDNLPCVRREFVVAPRIDSSLVTFEPISCITRTRSPAVRSQRSCRSTGIQR